eukprot:scaffold576_cov260-Pinguiococcus_pyrenoidosus.AAC.81
MAAIEAVFASLRGTPKQMEGPGSPGLLPPRGDSPRFPRGVSARSATGTFGFVDRGLWSPSRRSFPREESTLRSQTRPVSTCYNTADGQSCMGDERRCVAQEDEESPVGSVGLYIDRARGPVLLRPVERVNPVPTREGVGDAIGTALPARRHWARRQAGEMEHAWYGKISAFKGASNGAIVQ